MHKTLSRNGQSYVPRTKHHIRTHARFRHTWCKLSHTCKYTSVNLYASRGSKHDASRGTKQNASRGSKLTSMTRQSCPKASKLPYGVKAARRRQSCPKASKLKGRGAIAVYPVVRLLTETWNAHLVINIHRGEDGSWASKRGGLNDQRCLAAP